MARHSTQSAARIKFRTAQTDPLPRGGLPCGFSSPVTNSALCGPRTHLPLKNSLTTQKVSNFKGEQVSGRVSMPILRRGGGAQPLRQRRQAFDRVEIAQHRVGFDFDFGDRLGVP